MRESVGNFMAAARTFWLCASACLCGLGAAAAQEPAPKFLAGNFVWENDSPYRGHDYDYTNGVLFSVTAASAPEFLQKLAKNPFFNHTPAYVLVDYSLSQQMFTPRDLAATTPDPLDRPYAGLALASASLIAPDDPAPNRRRGDRFDQFTAQIGVVGPDAGGKGTQTWFHDRIGGIEPGGWDYQIPNRLVGGISYERTQRLWLNAGESPQSWDLLYHWGGSLGSVKTQANLGATFRIGYNRPLDIGVPRLSASLPGSGYFERPGGADWGLYGFVSAEATYVAYDATLDERAAISGAGVQKYNAVGDLQVGVVGYVRRLRIGLTGVFATKQFQGQRDNDGYGALSVSWAFERDGERR
ncbi:MAG TPA: lipid A deacylase LpxR family protein [Caulobacterales bacterium]|nr:lipid A deacylase LpxR family protein [Caulobacterales bacterium]